MDLAYEELKRRRTGVTVINLGVFDSAAHPRAPKGQPEGGQFVAAGKARDQKGAEAQKNQTAKKNYEDAQKANNAKPGVKPDPNAPKGVSKDMSDKDLQDLSRYAYSFKSNDPQVVKLRVQIASELARRKMDVNDYGGLGKSKKPTIPMKGKKVATKQVVKAKRPPAGKATRNSKKPAGKATRTKKPVWTSQGFK